MTMSGTFAIFSSSLEPTELRKELIKCSSKLRHRGPDWSGYLVVEKDGERPLNHGIAHERLAIMDPESGEQPLVSPDGNIIVAANGEIYNYKEIYAGLSTPYTPKTGSDCEVMLPLWSEMNGIPTPDLPNKLRGMFSVIMYDKTTDTYFIFRDHIGKTPLYIGWGNDGSVYVASEMKSLVHECNKFQNFPPGHCYSNKGPNAGKFVRWYKPNLPSSAVREILQLASVGCKLPSPRGPVDFDFSSVANVDVVVGGLEVRVYSSDYEFSDTCV